MRLHQRLSFISITLVPMLAVPVLICCATPVDAADADDGRSSVLPTGKRITPWAAPGAHFETLNPGLADFPSFLAGQAISTAVSPDNHTLLILTSGYNLNSGPDGNNVPGASQEYVF